MNTKPATSSVLKDTPDIDPMAMLESELHAGLGRYWQIAGTILDGSPVDLIAPNQATFSLQRNFFSALFLYSYYRSGIDSDRRILYAAVNQCLRGMVTGCDNILDDEYKKTLETDLPAQAERFRSVLDIMVSDRILTELLLDYCQDHKLPSSKVIQATTASLHALLQSGVQEATEEGGIEERLRPEDILTKIHHYKTGVLFQCTWAIPAVFEDTAASTAQTAQEALYTIGMGCQLLDDIVDLYTDLRDKRHNYVLSTIAHDEPPHVWQRLEALLATTASPQPFYAEFPELFTMIKAKALQALTGGLNELFFDHHRFLVQPAVAFIAGRIGVDFSQG